MEDDLFYMKQALGEADKAAMMDEVPVGAVLVNKNGEVMARGHNQTIILNDPSGHAEMLALRRAAKAIGNYRLPGSTLYVTIEPCIMCMGAVIHARIKRVVFGAEDPKWGGAGSLYNFALDTRFNHRPEIVSGVCRDEAQEVIRSFFRNKRSR